MLYIVGGLQRSGTSVMMQALENSGLLTASALPQDVNAELAKAPHYNSQLGGPYELPKQEYLSLDFPDDFDGYLIKVMGTQLIRMKPQESGIKLVFMQRNPKDIQYSQQKYFGNCYDLKVIEHLQKLLPLHLENRKDVELRVVNYSTMVYHPQVTFNRLARFLPIDADEAASVIDPTLNRAPKIHDIELNVSAEIYF